MENIKIEVKTIVFENGCIEQTVCNNVDFIERNARQIIDTKEEQVRKALIDLGWTPPKYIKVNND